jgi:hypothetical protein
LNPIWLVAVSKMPRSSNRHVSGFGLPLLDSEVCVSDAVLVERSGQ